jgi:transcriptional regulator
MYTPSYYKEADFQKLLAFMQHHPFALLCSSGDGGLMGTHLPFIVEEKEQRLCITSHMAKPNPQGKELESGTELMLVFQGPHGYVSPSNYELKQNVPTWNYIAVHAYGKAKMITSPEDSVVVLEKMIGTFEPAFRNQWNELTDKYKEEMLKGIVSFEIEVTKLEGKFKLSQNKKKTERENIIHSFETNGDEAAREIAKEMKKLVK